MRNKIWLSTKRRKEKRPIRLIFSDFGTVFFGWFWWFFCCVFWGGFFFFFGAFSVRCCGRIFFNFLVALPLLFRGFFRSIRSGIFLSFLGLLAVVFVGFSGAFFLLFFFGFFGFFYRSKIAENQADWAKMKKAEKRGKEKKIKVLR